MLSKTTNCFIISIRGFSNLMEKPMLVLAYTTFRNNSHLSQQTTDNVMCKATAICMKRIISPIKPISLAFTVKTQSSDAVLPIIIKNSISDSLYFKYF